MQTGLKGKHLLCEQDWTNEELETLFAVASELKMRYALDLETEWLKNKSLFMLFFEESTRTRNAFECGITQLGGHANYLTPKATQIDHGETPKDTIEVLSRMGHASACAIRSSTALNGCRALRSIPKFRFTTMLGDLWHRRSPLPTCSRD